MGASCLAVLDPNCPKAALARVPQPFGCDTIVHDSDGYEWQMLKSWTGHVYDGIKIGLTRCNYWTICPPAIRPVRLVAHERQPTNK